MGKITDGVRTFAKKLGNTARRWPKRKRTEAEKRQLDRWEGEGGSFLDEDSQQS